MSDLEKLLEETTPGPWSIEIEADCDDETPSVYVCHGGTVCDATTVCNLQSESVTTLDIRKSNARLIAMAPDLARKVIAAEKLAEAARRYADGYVRDEASEPDLCVPGQHEDAIALFSALADWEAAQ